MKQSALSFLVCTKCKGPLDLAVAVEHGAEIIEGTLTCWECGTHYPVRRGVPRFVKVGDYASSFGDQWNWFRTVQLDSVNGTRESESMLEKTTGWRAEDYQGRMVLDAGVGAGRFAEIVSKSGGEVVGVDLTNAVDAAYLTLHRHPNAHLIQADIFELPFRDGTFDLAYSIGVLHHTPDPRKAFDCVARTVKKGGGMAVYLYSRYGVGHHASDLFRVVTTRLPRRVMLALSSAAIPLYYVYRFPLLGKLLALAFPISNHPNWRWRWLDTFDWYTPRYQWKFLYPEVCRWFRENGFDVELFDDPIRIRGVRTGDSHEPH